MNRTTACLSITVLMTATAYGMDKDYGMDTDYSMCTEKVAIKDMTNKFDLNNYEVTLPEQNIVEQRINGLNLPDTFFERKFDKEKLITNIAQLNRVSTIGEIHLQITLPFGEPLIEKWKNPALSWRVPNDETDKRRDEDYKNHLRPYCLKVMGVLLQDHPEHEVLMARIDELKLIG